MTALPPVDVNDLDADDVTPSSGRRGRSQAVSAVWTGPTPVETLSCAVDTAASRSALFVLR